jgi:hypothetical protein
MKATIVERGNGLPNKGDRVWDADSGDVYRIVSHGRIQTDRLDGNYYVAQVRCVGSIHDMSDRAVDALSDCAVELRDEA